MVFSRCRALQDELVQVKIERQQDANDELLAELVLNSPPTPRPVGDRTVANSSPLNFLAEAEWVADVAYLSLVLGVVLVIVEAWVDARLALALAVPLLCHGTGGCPCLRGTSGVWAGTGARCYNLRPGGCRVYAGGEDAGGLYDARRGHW